MRKARVEHRARLRCRVGMNEGIVDRLRCRVGMNEGIVDVWDMIDGESMVGYVGSGLGSCSGLG